MATRQDRPRIPPSIFSDDIVAIITVSDLEFPTHLQDTTCTKTSFIRRWSPRTRRKAARCLVLHWTFLLLILQLSAKYFIMAVLY